MPWLLPLCLSSPSLPVRLQLFSMYGFMFSFFFFSIFIGNLLILQRTTHFHTMEEAKRPFMLILLNVFFSKDNIFPLLTFWIFWFIRTVYELDDTTRNYLASYENRVRAELISDRNTWTALLKGSTHSLEWFNDFLLWVTEEEHFEKKSRMYIEVIYLQSCK